MKLSEQMKAWRSGRPTEDIMDRFIKQAIELEEKAHNSTPIKTPAGLDG